jgi:uncharacterized Zn finger protein
MADRTTVASKRATLPRQWWTEAWLAGAAASGWEAALFRARQFGAARSRWDLVLEIGSVCAQGPGGGLHTARVDLRFPTLPESSIEATIETLASRAASMAELLDGELPRPLVGAIAVTDFSLFPLSGDRVFATCACRDRARPCKHVGIALLLLADAIDRDPFVLFMLRGVARNEILVRVARRRAAVLTLSSEYPAPERDVDESAGLTSDITAWTARGPIPVDATPSDESALDRLGSAPRALGGGEIRGELTVAYRRLAERARQTRREATERVPRSDRGPEHA